MLPINYFAVFAAALLYMVIGALWYSPFLFGNLWMKLNGFNKHSMKERSRDMGRKYVMMFMASLIASFILALIIKMLLFQTFLGGFRIGFLCWFGFTGTAQFANWLFSGKPKELFFIDTSYPLIALCLMGGILAIWQ